METIGGREPEEIAQPLAALHGESGEAPLPQVIQTVGRQAFRYRYGRNRIDAVLMPATLEGMPP